MEQPQLIVVIDIAHTAFAVAHEAVFCVDGQHRGAAVQEYYNYKSECAHSQLIDRSVKNICFGENIYFDDICFMI
jgi:hypothetical protein